MIKLLTPIFALLYVSLICLSQTFGQTKNENRGAQSPPPLSRTIAITFDDLPAAARARNYDAAAIKQMTSKLLRSFASHQISVVAFVNEKGLYQKKGEVDERIEVLQMWLDAGHELGNHTFSHASFNTTPLAAYEDDVIRGETVTKMLLEAKGMKLRYFRYPYFFTGPTPEIKEAFEAFLAKRGYTNAPATIDCQDYIFADVYARAAEKGDKVTMDRVAEAYVAYMEKMMEFYELSRDLFGREIPQVFYIHASLLNADHFDGLAEMLKKRGYSFTSLEKVLQDKAYSHPDRYAGTNGISWLQRWAITDGKQFGTEPDVPDFVKKLFDAK